MPLSGLACASPFEFPHCCLMQHTHDASNQRAPRARAAVVPHVPAATSSEVALSFAILLLALLVLLL